MNITKLGHSCLLVEKKISRIIIDPGIWSSSLENLTDIRAIFITHAHGDHASVDKISQLLSNNPEAVIYCNEEIAKMLEENGIKSSVVKPGDKIDVGEVVVEVFDTPHEGIYETVSTAINTGFLINKKLFHPGDSMTPPDVPVEILALPAGAPWLRGVAQGINYVKAVKPKVVFPIHDAFFSMPEVFYNHYINNLPEGSEFKVLKIGEKQEF